MNRLCTTAVLLNFVLTAPVFASTPAADKSGCAAEAHRVLQGAVRVVRAGNLAEAENFQCFVVVPYPARQGSELLIQRGAILERNGSGWATVLRIDGWVRNQKGYIGVDFIERSRHAGFALTTAEKRSDGTAGFTLFLTYLGPKLRREQGMALEVSWNPAVHRYQEYAPNELDPPGFKPEVANPVVRP